MKMTRRLIALILLLCLVLAGCGQAAPTAEESRSIPQPVQEEYSEPLQQGCNQLTFYWNYPGGYENCDMWIWWDGADGKGYRFHECDYGAKVIVNVPEGIAQVGFIVRRDCSDPGGTSWGSATKDYEQDRFAAIEGRETFIYLKSGQAEQYISNDGGKTLEMAKKFTLATIADENKIQYRISPKTTITDLSQIKLYEGDREIALSSVSTLGKAAASGYIETAEGLDLSGNYRIYIPGYGEKTLIPMEIFDSEYFAENYHYEGNDLGAYINGDSTAFKVWAPTASKVVLNLFTAGDGVQAYKTVEMLRDSKGVWQHTEPCGHGTYYTYSVTTALGTQQAVDPYAKAAGVNGERGMVVDLSLTDPEGWEDADIKEPISSYSEGLIWEVHVRDFSNRIAHSKYKGKYLAFTESGLENGYGQPVGLDYLKELGISHVHLLPVYDYATVDETGAGSQFNWAMTRKTTMCPRAAIPPTPIMAK